MVDSFQTVKRKLKPQEGSGGNTVQAPVIVPSDSMLMDSNKIEIVFVIDATGSMRNFINGVRESLMELVKDMKSELKSNQLMFGICFYRDKSEAVSEQSEIVPLQSIDAYIENESTAKPQFVERLEKIEVKGGDDTCEDVEMGFKCALKEIKWTSKNRYIVLVADAPSHGDKFSGKCDDNYPEEDMTPTIKEILNQDIILIGLDFKKETDAMFAQIKSIIDPYDNNEKFFKFSIKDDQKNTKAVAAKIATAVGGTVKGTMKRKVKKLVDK